MTNGGGKPHAEPKDARKEQQTDKPQQSQQSQEAKQSAETTKDGR